jgi:hypothetical protein
MLDSGMMHRAGPNKRYEAALERAPLEHGLADGHATEAAGVVIRPSSATAATRRADCNPGSDTRAVRIPFINCV